MNKNHLIRIVKMEFHTGHVAVFLDNFNHVKQQIRNAKGCQLLELYRDKTNPNIFFTYSHWDTEEDLNNYRESILFKTVWSKIKPLFSNKPKAWSVDKLS